MTDFQLTLAGIIVVIIVAVLAYNRWQEAKYRQRAQRTFGSGSGAGGDALLDKATLRLEPQIGAIATIDDMPDLDPIEDPQMDAARAVRLTDHPEVPRASALGVQAEIDCVALVLADQPLPPDSYHTLRDQLLKIDQRVICEGLVGGLWQPIDAHTEERFRELRAGLQLASRGGATELMVIEQTLAAVGEFADSIGAVSQREEALAAHARARALDAFCADTDVEIVVNLVGKNGVTFAPTKVRGVAEAQGFSQTESGEYLYRDEGGRALFILRNGDTALPPGLRGTTAYISSLALALDVPRVPVPAQAFERMFGIALKFADSLQAELVDDNKTRLTARGRTAISEAIREIAAKMEEHGVVPGSPAALRLYA